MECVEIQGGKPLSGRVEIQGSKNAVLPMLAGCILHEGVSRIDRCPKIQDVFDMIELLEELGCTVWWEENCLAVDAAKVTGWKIPGNLAARMRSSILFLGALLGRTGRAVLPYPGGCVLGARPVDLHICAMEAMGAIIREEEDAILARTDGLRGCEIVLRFPSVGATENIILAAVLADGVTVIHNAAQEPEISELCLFLREKGAVIWEEPGGRIRIRGTKALHDSRHELAADRIVAGTYLLAAAVTGGCITIEKAPWEHMKSFLEQVEHMGIRLERSGRELTADCRERRKNIGFLETAPYPGFPTDMQSPMMTLLAVTEGQSRIRENIFEARFKIAEQLQKMGARIAIEGNEAVIDGVDRLHGAKVGAEELRGAAALFLAGLNAEGTTRITGCHFADRGYVDICKDLAGLGARITVTE